MSTNTTKREQEITLKDGRKLYKTNNGFKAWLVQEGGDIEVGHDYYNQVKKHKI